MAIPELPINGLETPEYHGLQLTKHDYSLQFPEQAKYDVALQLPERDTAIDAPEYDSGGNAPERDVGREAPEWNIGGEFPGNIAVSTRGLRCHSSSIDTCLEKVLACSRDIQ